ADGVAARRDREAVRGVEPVARVRGREGAHRGAVDLHPEGLVANGGAEGPLGGQEAEAVGAGREGDRLADGALLLQEGDLEALGAGGVAAGEAAAVGGQARAVAVVLVRAGELPGRAGRAVLEGTSGERRGLKSATIDEEGRDADGVEEGGLELVGAEADK